MADFAIIANEVFKVLQSYDYTVMLYNDEGMRVAEPDDARRMFDRQHNIMVSLTDEDDDSQVLLQIGKHTHAADVMGLIQALRATSTKYNMTFRVRNFNKDIDPKQFSQLASISEAHKDTNMEVLEGMYGTSRSSYLRLENARMIVRHKARIDDSKMGARSRMVETILIENGMGERFRFPTANLAAGRAMTQHVNQGGTFADPVGQQITSMAETYGHLAEAVRSVKRLKEASIPNMPTPSGGSAGSNPASSTPPSSTISDSEMLPESRVQEACKCKMDKLRKTFENLYRPSSYASEAADLTARANLLTESDVKIDEARLAELRQLLSDDDLNEKVYECTAKAMDEIKEATVITEGETVSVFDYRVDKGAWEEFRRGKLRLKERPIFDKHPFTSAIAELIYRLGQIVPVVADDSMANLLSYVADELPESGNKRQLALIGLQALKSARKQAVQPEVQEAPAATGNSVGVLGHQVNAGVWNELKHGKLSLSGAPMFDKHPFRSAVAELIYRLGQIVPKVKDDSLANLLAFVADRLPDVESQEERKKYAQIGMLALKAARQTPDEHALADKNDVIQEMYRWFAQFTTDKALVEGIDPMNPMNPYSSVNDSGYDDALDGAIENFDPWAFLENEYAGGELIHNLDPKNPNENVVDKGELMQCLMDYLRDETETLSGFYIDDEKAIENLAHLVYDKTVEALQERGFIVKDGGDLTEGPLDEAEELTREDILLPPKNMGDDLSGEVSKATVHDPDTDQERNPDSNYVARLKTLAGMNTGQNTTGY